jgi:hypothetical protein
VALQEAAISSKDLGHAVPRESLEAGVRINEGVIRPSGIGDRNPFGAGRKRPILEFELGSYALVVEARRRASFSGGHKGQRDNTIIADPGNGQSRSGETALQRLPTSYGPETRRRPIWSSRNITPVLI